MACGLNAGASVRFTCYRRNVSHSSRRLAVALLPLALLTACEPRESRPSPQATAPPEVTADAIPPAPPAASSPLPSRTLLLGEWRLVAIDGAPPPPGAYPIELIFTDGALRAQSQCISWNWLLSVEAGRLRLRPPPGPVTMCARGLSVWEKSFGAAMAAAARIESDGEQATVTGPAGSLRLKRAH